jgi:hypothetical protein
MQNEASAGFSFPQFEQLITRDAIPRFHADASGRRSQSLKTGSYGESGNVLGNTIPLTNLKLLVVGGLIHIMVECYGPLLCKVSGPRGGLVKHEDLGASPQMAKRLEDILARKTPLPLRIDRD